MTAGALCVLLFGEARTVWEPNFPGGGAGGEHEIPRGRRRARPEFWELRRRSDPGARRPAGWTAGGARRDRIGWPAGAPPSVGAAARRRPRTRSGQGPSPARRPRGTVRPGNTGSVCFGDEPALQTARRDSGGGAGRGDPKLGRVGMSLRNKRPETSLRRKTVREERPEPCRRQSHRNSFKSAEPVSPGSRLRPRRRPPPRPPWDGPPAAGRRPRPQQPSCPFKGALPLLFVLAFGRLWTQKTFWNVKKKKKCWNSWVGHFQV